MLPKDIQAGAWVGFKREGAEEQVPKMTSLPPRAFGALVLARRLLLADLGSEMGAKNKSKAKPSCCLRHRAVEVSAQGNCEISFIGGLEEKLDGMVASLLGVELKVPWFFDVVMVHLSFPADHPKPVHHG